MSQLSENDPLFSLLERQNQKLRQLDRVLWWVLPIVAFLLSVMCANFNWQSTLGTFVVLMIALCGAGILRWNIPATVAAVVLYACLDNFLSYGQMYWPHLRLQLGTMLIFVGMVGVGRPYIDHWLLHKIK